MNATYTPSETAQRAQTLYDQQIRPYVEADHKGKFVVVEVNTGDYEMDRQDIAALKRIEARHPDGRFFILRVGFPTAYQIGGGVVPNWHDYWGSHACVSSDGAFDSARLRSGRSGD